MPQITPWEGLAASSLHMFIGVLLPVLMMYVILMMGRIENLNNAWKQILVMPVKRGTFYLIKYLVVLLVLIVALVSYLTQYTLAAYFLCAKGMIPEKASNSYSRDYR
ncbi:ABC transporter permease [Clostridium sp. FP1]|uniref:ABC transporter permease n=1 Tax=Clostridium sp. FP1 TaxID=2724076 RepID=UPI001CCA445C|nr:ABC transporter permease [Clostridium sp. FP1]MBZ9633993.1 ABC transporter permease [Clostridium sp. FP1]